MISFEEPSSNALSPNHYIEITKDRAGADGKAFSQPQRILLCIESENTKPSFMKATTENKMVEAVKAMNSSASIYLLQYQKDKLNQALKELPEEQFTQVALDKPTQDNVNSIITELDKRWKSDSQIDGHLFVVKTTKESLNVDSKHVTIINHDKQNELGIWAASFAALNAQYATEPSRPYSSLKVPGLISGLTSNLTERNALLKKGISTYKTNISGQVFIDRLITTSKENEFKSLEVKQTLSAIRYDLRKYFETRFSRYMLAKSDHPYPGPVLSPKSIKALLVSRYRLYQSQNLVQDDGSIADRIRVEVSKSNSSRVDIFFPMITMGQLLITQTQIAFST